MLISSKFNAAAVQQPAGVCYNRLRETIIPTSSFDALADVSDWLQIHVLPLSHIAYANVPQRGP